MKTTRMFHVKQWKVKIMAASDYKPTEYPDFGDVDAVNKWTGLDRWNAIYTITLGELIEHDLFNWDNDLLNWSEAAYNDEQYKRVCDYFIERFRFREISIEPFYEWAAMLKRKIVYELMPKYSIMYKVLDDEFDITQDKTHYDKSRAITSNYPETLLSGNADYISSGNDNEREFVEQKNTLESYLLYSEKFQAIDMQMLDELESMFIGLYSVSMNGA